MNEEPMRLFFAIELGDALLDLLGQTTAPLRVEAPELAWVRREHRHLTLKFLDDVDEASAPKLIVAADRAAARHSPTSPNTCAISRGAPRGSPPSG